MKSLAIPSSGIVAADTGLYLSPATLDLHVPRSESFVRLRLASARQRNIHPIFCLSSKPQRQVEFYTADNGSEELCQSKTVRVKFQIQKECSFGHEFLLIGDDPMFGVWDPDNGIPLTWSEGHVWAVEMDMPIGKTIQFKFILKESTGTITWQPGSDRTFQSWETNNTITVCEEWEDAEQQKLIEDDGYPFPIQNEDLTVNLEVMAVSEKITSPKEELVLGISNGSAVADNNSYPGKKRMSGTREELMFTRNIPSEEVKGVAIVADNIGNPKKDSVVNAGNESLDDRRNGRAKKENVAIPNKDKMISKGALGQNGRVAAVNSRVTDNENQEMYEGAPVLLPGLTSFSLVVETEEVVQVEGEKSSGIGITDGPHDAKDCNVPEMLKKQQLGADECQKQGTSETFGDEGERHASLEQHEEGVEHHDELKQQPLSVEEEEQVGSEPIHKDVIVNDIQWGRRTLQKLLADLGLG